MSFMIRQKSQRHIILLLKMRNEKLSYFITQLSSYKTVYSSVCIRIYITTYNVCEHIHRRRITDISIQLHIYVLGKLPDSDLFYKM